MDRMRAMELFLRVVETGSFTAAAQALRMPRTSATTELQALEAHLGVRLLHRTTRRVSLTNDGSLYYEEVRRLLKDLAEVESSLGRSAASTRGRIRVDVPAAAGRHLIAPALPAFFARHPDIVLELGSSDRPVDLVAEGVDCVVRGGDVHDESLVGRRLAHLPVVTCAAPGYLAARGTPRTPHELEGHVFVNYFSSRTGKVFEVDWRPPGAGPDARLVVRMARHLVAANDSDTWVALAVAGLGLLQTPCSAHVRACLERGELRLVMPGWRSEPLPSNILYPAARHLPARVRLFIDWLSELYTAEAQAAERFVADAEARALASP
ncbi:LysR family transcriptional regulator [Myxococcus stipitatus]|uniref:LysR family transcriptional regulator n=1 Tax=Myxococcus stipitatus TaxID=83455 RepID=UPI001F37F2E4|nr:LysR family transcriptional regulator [Myxococcus stipitatus]MCE9670932.1 LysR family transcriptional regulator [Myxococcus stipitatus]